MGELRNCPQCDRLFTYLGVNLCPACIDQEEVVFKMVRTYVRDHPGATIFDTAEATGVDEEKILHYLREGRLVSNGIKASAMLRCERCGKEVDEGRFCKECAYELDRQVRQTIGSSERNSAPEPPSKDRDREKMFIMDADLRKKRNKY
ncbi:MAG: TIGR03826 family flagellar region protein [Chitinophagales bacterium]